MTNATFNQEIKRAIKNDNHPVLIYINEEFRKSNSRTYYDFFDNFLFDFGILSLNYVPMLDVNKYVPYVNCLKNNIFNQESGISNLSIKGHSQVECQKMIANFVIRNLKSLFVSNFENWKSELNNGVIV